MNGSIVALAGTPAARTSLISAPPKMAAVRDLPPCRGAALSGESRMGHLAGCAGQRSDRACLLRRASAGPDGHRGAGARFFSE
jgi:hypothetical protein